MGYAVHVDGQPYELGPYVPPVTHYALLSNIIQLYRPKVNALEFGVGKGESTRIIADYMPVLGFDSFEGLPEDWREGFPAGSFAVDAPPEIDNARFEVGRFEEFDRRKLTGLRTVGLMHIDCDLYSSTRTALDIAMPMIHRIPPNRCRGLIIVFDEWHGYDGCEQHEQRAWREFVESIEGHIQWRVIGHSHQAWGIQIL